MGKVRKGPAPKGDKTQIIQRVTEIVKLKLEGYTRSHIMQHGKKWGVTDDAIDKYIGTATKQIAEVSLASIEEHRDTIIGGLLNLYRAALRDSNNDLARKILMDLAKLKGLDQQVINHNVKLTREVIDVSDSDLTLLLESDDPTDDPTDDPQDDQI